MANVAFASGEISKSHDKFPQRLIGLSANRGVDRDFEASGQRRPAPMSQNVLSRAQGKRSRVDDLGTRCQEALSNLRKA